MQTVEEILKDNGFRITKGKVKILSFFIKRHSPISFKELEKKLIKDLDRASIYRSLKDFLDKKIISKINLKNGESYYEFINHKDSKGEHHHHHIVCDDCGKIEEVEFCFKKDFEKKILKNSKNFSSSLHHTLEFFGKCNGCERK